MEHGWTNGRRGAGRAYLLLVLLALVCRLLIGRVVCGGGLLLEEAGGVHPPGGHPIVLRGHHGGTWAQRPELETTASVREGGGLSTDLWRISPASVAPVPSVLSLREITRVFGRATQHTL